MGIFPPQFFRDIFFVGRPNISGSLLNNAAIRKRARGDILCVVSEEGKEKEYFRVRKIFLLERFFVCSAIVCIQIDAREEEG